MSEDCGLRPEYKNLKNLNRKLRLYILGHRDTLECSN